MSSSNVVLGFSLWFLVVLKDAISVLAPGLGLECSPCQGLKRFEADFPGLFTDTFELICFHFSVFLFFFFLVVGSVR